MPTVNALKKWWRYACYHAETNRYHKKTRNYTLSETTIFAPESGMVGRRSRFLLGQKGLFSGVNSLLVSREGHFHRWFGPKTRFFFEASRVRKG